ncbi:GTP cyclohydrolase FolE2 [Roseicyclus sp. F158]|uniref:GTP cyclohydrolase FolE2 n=1 Tax=Tropicimonas omnivorans TaxID=3075590 RepID=A0ABU3DFY5_9RHOB|nr:GTP cyclohydrolase FolE2 [Roseicyclus sp. F158]MDT0682609.1 GTP cyclohydrolase FolE2 [Roseicyclus sp. F158]
MNIQSADLGALPTDEDALEAVETLRAWAARASSAEIAALGPDAARLVGQVSARSGLAQDYDAGFRPDAAYLASLPDLQNGPAALIRGARREIQHVGISNFRLPVQFATRGGAPMLLETSVTGTVSLEASAKGINMSRIMRSFYDHAGEAMGFELIDRALDAYKRELGSFDARIALATSFPLMRESLRSGLAGWQYYDVAAEIAERGGTRLRILHVDYVYSSTCPCSLELAEHARTVRGTLATPHSQRSLARLSVVLDPEAPELPIEDLIEHCRAAVPTETQVMVKREDEQAFAELNAANPIFVEDAARLFAEALQGDHRIGDFRVAASHQESLHSHDAVSILTEGPTFDAASLDPRFLGTLQPRG